MSGLNILLAALILFTAIARIAEIVFGEINARRMLEKGGKEFAKWQRPVIVVIYSLWLGAMLLATPDYQEPRAAFLLIFILMQMLRWWAIAHLKGYWTTRIIIMPLAWKVATGPYRFLKHPVYLVLMTEVVALSLAFDQLAPACFFGGLVMLWLFFRMRAENRALSMML
jgi:methyltransferase